MTSPAPLSLSSAVPATALSFFRKRQTIHSLERERPQSLKAFYHAALLAVDEIEQRLEMKKDYFYGKDISANSKIKEYLFDVNMVVTKLALPSIFSTKQVEDVLHMAQDPNATRQVDLVHVDNMRQVIGKILSAAKTDFQDIESDMVFLVAFVMKYCVAFCDRKTAVGLNNEVVLGYQKLIEESTKTISENKDRVQRYVKKFEHRGLFLDDLDYDMKHLARHFGCTHSVYLLLYEIAGDGIKTSCDIVKRWIKADATYIKDIKIDIVNLEEVVMAKGKEVRSLQDCCFQHEFKTKSAKKDMLDLFDESERLQDKECAIINLEASLMEDRRQLEMDLDLKVMRRGMLIESAKEMTSREYSEKTDRLQDETMAVKEQLAVTARKLEEIKAKTKWLKSRRRLRLEKRKVFEDAKAKMKSATRNMTRIVGALDGQKQCLRTLRNIYVQKTSTDALRRIFHNMPLQRRQSADHMVPHTPASENARDDVDKAIKIVSYKIGTDWMKFYYSLPFFPFRGEENVTSDLTEIVQSNMRANTQTKAMQSLIKWRRLHTRASVNDLKSSLRNIKRDDVIALVERHRGKHENKGSQHGSHSCHVHLPRLAVMIDDEGNSSLQIQ